MIDYFSTIDIPSLLMNYGYFILLPLIVVEGPIVTIIAGFLASLGYFNVFILYIVAVLGDLIGDIIYYALGRWGHQNLFAEKHFLWIRTEQLEKLKNHFDKHFGKTLLLGKWTHAIGAPILVASGMAKVSLEKFILFNFIGTLPKALVFIGIGYYFGRAYKQINVYFDYAAAIIFSVVILAAGAYLIRTLKRRFGKKDKS